MTLYLHEIRMNRKSLFIWSICIGLICAGCIMLYNSMEGSMDQMSDMFANLGTMSEALGMDKVSIGTVEGYYAIEIAIMFTLGGAMFAAMLGGSIVAKEEEGHTSEYLNMFPMSRSGILVGKYLAMLTLIVFFQVICLVLILLGFLGIGCEIPVEEFVKTHLTIMIMHMEVGSICFLISACVRKKPVGASLGLAVLLYMGDLMCRVVPALENLKYVIPFYYANAADIFSGEKINGEMIAIGAAITIVTFVGSLVVYSKRDLAA